VEASGAAGGLAAAIGLVRAEGAILLKSTIAGEHTIDLAPLVINEVRVLGSRCGPFPPAIEALAAGAVAGAPLIDGELPLSGAAEALERASAPGALKILLAPAASV